MDCTRISQDIIIMMIDLIHISKDIINMEADFIKITMNTMNMTLLINYRTKWISPRNLND
jgi:hypothetical protein